MPSEAMFWYFLSVIWVPVYFIGYSVLHIVLHHRDGQEGGKIRHSYTYKLKQILLVFLVVVCFVDAAIEIGNVFLGVYVDYTDFVRPAYYVFGSLAWGLCFYLVRFDFKRRLKMGRYGQRTFWVVSVPLFVIDIFLMDNDFGAPDLTMGIRIATDALSAFFSFWLAFLALCRPDDFGSRVEGLYEPLRASHQSEQYANLVDLALQVEILDFKSKVESGKAVVLYNIQVSVGDYKYCIKRPSASMEQLAGLLEELIMHEHIQGLVVPKFPELTYRDSSMSKIIDELSRFLREACKPVHMFNEVCDFFAIPPQIRDSIKAEQHKLLQFFRQTTELHPSFFEEHSSDLTGISHKSSQLFFLVTVPQYTDTGDYVEYCIQWQSVKTGTTGKCNYRYNGMLNFYKELKNILGPVTLPEFPGKHRMSFLSAVSKQESVAQRMACLNKFYEELLNDPAYLCDLLLKFVSCDIPLDVIWSTLVQGVFYKLSGQMTSERQLEPKPFVNYIFTVVKYESDRLVGSWTLARRYSQFEALHDKLKSRAHSPMLRRYLHFMKEDVSLCAQVPTVPGKSLPFLRSSQEIVSRQKDLQKFMEKCFELRHIVDSHCFQAFIEEPLL
jgi:hypothetical protein